MISPEDSDFIRVEELMRGSIIEYKEERPLHKGYGKWFRDLCWGITGGDDGRDYVEIGQFGSQGYIDLSCIKGIDITEDLMLEYGFLITKNLDNHLMLFRDDFGYVKFATYGIEHIYMAGKAIKYLHNFQRIFLDYTGRTLHPKQSKPPKEPPKFSVEIKKQKSGEELLHELKDLQSRSIDSFNVSVDLEIDISPSLRI